MRIVHWYYKFLIVFIIFFSMFFLLNRNISSVVNKSNYKNYMSFISTSFSYIDKYNVFKYKKIVKRNEQLDKELLMKNTIDNEKTNLSEEIKVLKETMKLKNTYSNYDLVYAKTVIRNKMYWYSTITIDKGINDGIEEGFAVVSKDGLIGIVKSVTKDYSTVKLITNSDRENKISTMVKSLDKTKIGLIEGYNYPYIKVSLTTDENGIKIGDILTTSGLGNLPKGIYIGKIQKIEKDNYNLGTILYVEPNQDMNNINYVAVLKNK